MIRRFERASRAAIPLLALALLAGCSGRSPQGPRTDDAKEPEEPVVPPVHAERGEATQYSAGANREPLWRVEWVTGDIQVDPSDRVNINLETVSGEIMKNRAPAARFRAERGGANQVTNQLQLEGRVEVRATGRDAVLHADTVRYDGNMKIITASGNVRVTSAYGELRMDEDLVATPDLKTFGSKGAVKLP